MAKSLFEEMGGTYTQVGDYLLPDLKLPEESQRPIGVWGERRRKFLKEHRKALYTSLMVSGKLNGHLADINEEAEAMMEHLVREMAHRQGITEELKAQDMMAWVGSMNNIRNAAEEIVREELIYG